MTRLSKEAAGLVDAGRTALRPSAADKLRVSHALKVRLSPDAAVPQLTDSAAATAGQTAWLKVAMMVAGVASAVTAAVLIWPSVPVAGVPAPVLSAHVPEPALQVEPATPSAVLVVPQSVSSAAVAAPEPVNPVAPRTLSSSAASDRLGEEVALLTRAQREFQARHLSRSLAIVDEHRREFPRGALVQERFTLRSRILCAMGRTSEAESEQKALQRLAPGQAASAGVGACPETRGSD